MKVFHVVTVGTAILLNFARTFKDEAEELKISSWGRLPPDHDDQKKAEASAHRGSKVFDRLLEYVNSDPYSASAELNAFYRFTDLYGPSRIEDIEIGLYTTDTGTGYLCGRIVYEHLKSRGYYVNEPVRVRGFGLGASLFDEALSNLIDKIAGVVKSKKNAGYRVYVNATAGFKPETSFATIISMVMGADKVYYIHESFREVVALPLLPITVKEEFLSLIDRIYPHISLADLKDIIGYERIKELEERGVIIIREGRVEPRPWIRKLYTMIKGIG